MKEVKKPESKLFRQTSLDRVISYFSPERGVRRLQARATMALVGGYRSGDRSRRALKKFPLSHGSADAETIPYLDNLRSDSRDMDRNTPLARGAINTVVTNVVGTGLVPESAPLRDVLKDVVGLSEDQIKEFKAAAEREFRVWAKSRDADATRTQTFAGLQELAFRSALVSGDVFPIRRMVSRMNSRIAFAVQMIEADRVDNPSRKPDTASLTAGVERDALGAPVAYHIAKAHPGNSYLSRERFQTERFPAYLPNGEWNVLHIMTKERPEQTRGVPYLAPVVEPLKQLERYTDAEIMAAVVSSLFTVFVKTETGDSSLPGAGGTGESADSDEIVLGSGNILDLAAGESVEFANPGRPNTAFDPFVQAVMRQIGVALELPFELLIKHFTASYSAAQAAILEAWKFFRKRRVWLADSFCTPCWEAVITEAVARGYIAAPGFFSDPLVRAAYLSVEWIGPPRGVIDPLKEAKANEIYEDRQWKTSAEITAELTGGDWESKFETRAREEGMRRDASLNIADKAVQPVIGPEDNQQGDSEDDSD